MKPVVICLLLIPFSLFGQTLKFEKAFDVYPFGVDPVIKVINSGYLIAGGNTMDAFLMHLNENGDTLWTKFYDSLSDTAQIKEFLYNPRLRIFSEQSWFPFICAVSERDS